MRGGRSLRRRPRVEALEVRSLLSAGFVEVPMPRAGLLPMQDVEAPDGRVWFTEGSGAAVGRVNADGSVTEFGLPLAPSNEAEPNAIVVGPGGDLWFTAQRQDAIGRISANGLALIYHLPAGSQPRDLVAGPDGALWFTESANGNTDQLGRITTAGVVSHFALGPPSVTALNLAVGSDGALWITTPTVALLAAQNSILRFDPAQHTVTHVKLPPGNAFISSITEGPDGAIWFVSNSTSQLGRIDVQTSPPQVTELGLPQGTSFVNRLITGPDGALWFTASSGQVGRITTTGDATTHDLPEAQGNPQGITTGPDGQIWVAQPQAQAIDRLVLNPTDLPLSAAGVPVSAVEHTSGPFTVARFTDADPTAVPSDFRAVINWGPSQSVIGPLSDIPVRTQGTVTSDGQGGFVVRGSFFYGAAGNYPISVRISDVRFPEGGAVASANTTATVSDAPISSLMGLPSDAIVNRVRSFTLATFNLDESLLDYTAAIDWGDGSPVVPGSIATTFYFYGPVGPVAPVRDVVVSPPVLASGSVDGQHAYAAAGTYTVHVTVHDRDGATNSVTTTITVLAHAPVLDVSAQPITAVVGQTQPFLTAGTFESSSASAPSDFRVTVNWGDGTAPQVINPLPHFIFLPIDSSLSNAHYAVSAPHAYAHAGQFVVEVTVDNGSGHPVSWTTTAAVSNAPIDAVGYAFTLPSSQPQNRLVARFLDPTDLNGDHSSRYLAIIDWGDGSFSQGFLHREATTGLAYYDVSGQHDYRVPGQYKVHVAVVTAQGARRADTVNFATVTDGFTGWLDPSSDLGPSNRDGITSDNTPTFAGEAPPGTKITLERFAFAPPGVGDLVRPPILLTTGGPVVVGPSGTWHFTAPPVPNGAWIIVAQAQFPDGSTSPQQDIFVNGQGGSTLLVDTAAPRVTGASFDAGSAELILTVLDPGGLLAPAALQDRSAYHLAPASTRHAADLPVSGVTVTRGPAAGTFTVVVTFHGGDRVPQGTYVLAIDSAHVTDRAGNALGGSPLLAIVRVRPGQTTLTPVG